MTTSNPQVHGTPALRTRLLQRREQLEREVTSHVASVRGDAPPEPGGDAATLIQLHDVDLAEAERDNAELRDINAALARMDRGDYGLCGKCGAPIPHARLEASPQAPHCLNCASASEHAHGERPHPTL